MSRQFLTIREIVNKGIAAGSEQKYDVAGIDLDDLSAAMEAAIIKKVESSRAQSVNELVGRRLESIRSNAKIYGGQAYSRPSVMKKFQTRCAAAGGGNPHSIHPSFLRRVECGDQPLPFILAVSICEDLGIRMERLIPAGFLDGETLVGG